MARRKFKRYLSHNVGTGRDTHPRDLAVSEETFARNWCATFGHKRWDNQLEICRDCGMTAEELFAKEHPADCPHPHCNPAF